MIHSHLDLRQPIQSFETRFSSFGGLVELSANDIDDGLTAPANVTVHRVALPVVGEAGLGPLNN